MAIVSRSKLVEAAFPTPYLRWGPLESVAHSVMRLQQHNNHGSAPYKTQAC